MKILTAAQMQDVDRRTIDEVGVPGLELMENAGRGCAREIVARFPHLKSGRTLVLAGKGNNGGDGYVIARLLLKEGWSVDTIALAGREDVGGDAAANLVELEACGGSITFAPDDQSLLAWFSEHENPDLIVDALFGTGLAKEVGGRYGQAIDWINAQDATVVAVDIPSGVDATCGRILGRAVEADLTVTFAFPKIGQVSFPGAGRVGHLVTVDIGIPDEVALDAPSQACLVDAALAKALLPERPVDGHKGTFGHLLVLAGSVGKTGAAAMTAEAALRGGAGLATLACPATVQPILATKLTEVMTAPLVDLAGEVSLQAAEEILSLAADKQVLAIGPGLGVGDEVTALVRRLLAECSLPMVVDADALTALCGHLDALERRQGQTVLTPHPGEMARLLGCSSAEVQANRVDVARGFSQRYGVVLMLKGARTVTACPDGRLYVNDSGHAGMASGGMGDVLTGLIAGLIAQKMDVGEAAALGAFMHGHSGDLLRPVLGDAGMLATDLMHNLPAARLDLIKE